MTTLLLLVFVSQMTETTSVTLSVRVVDLATDAGQVGCALWASEKGFPKDHKTAVQTTWCSIANREALCKFESVAPATYAVACFHDANANGVLDTGIFGIPKEGVVVSNHAKGFMGPPAYAKAKFELRGINTELRLHVSY